MYFFSSTSTLFSPLLIILLLLVSSSGVVKGGDQAVAACASYYSITTYANITKNILAPNFKLGLVGGFKTNNMTEKISMMQFAVDYLNNQTDLLPNVGLQLVGTEISGVPSNTILASLAMVGDKAKVMMGGYGEDTETDALYAISSRYSIPQVAAYSRSVKYTNVDNYPNLFRAIPATNDKVSVVAGIVHHFGWKYACILVGDDDNGANSINIYNNSPYGKTMYNISYLMVTVPAASSSDKSKMTEISKCLNQTRILVLDLPASTAIRYLPQLNASGFFNPNYVTVLGDIVGNALMNNINLFKNSLSFLNGSIVFTQKSLGRNSFYDEMNERWMNSNPTKYPGKRPPSPNSWWAFESVYMVAKAVDYLVNQGTPAPNITGAQLLSTIPNIAYTGVTGEVRFNNTYPNRDRLGLWDVFNFYDNQLTYKFSLSYENPTIPYDIVEGNFTFFNGRTDIPIDFVRTIINYDLPTQAPFKYEDSYRDYSVGVAGAFGAVIGICTLVAVFAAVVLATKRDRFESYGMLFSATIIGGSCIAYAGAFSLIPEKTEALCLVFPWLVGIAFNIVYGCLFIKTWLLFKIHRSAQQLDKIDIPPLYMAKMIGIFILFELVVLIVWTVVDPPTLKYLQMHDSSYELQCHNEHPTLWAVFVGYKGLWVIFGTLLSIKTKYLTIGHAAARSVSNAIYNNLGLFVIGAPVAYGLSQVPRGTFIIEAALVILSFTFTMFILFFDIWFNIFFAHRDIVGQASKSAASAKPSPANTSSSGISGVIPPSPTIRTSYDSRNSRNSKNSKVSKDNSASLSKEELEGKPNSKESRSLSASVSHDSA